MSLIFITIIIFIISTFPVNAVEINIINSPESICREEEFSIEFNVFDPAHSLSAYSYKARIGSSSASLNQGQTFNSLINNWLDDTSSWTSFPTIKLNENGIATSSVKLKTKKTANTGNNLLIIRANKDSKNYDSQSKNILIVESIFSSTPIETPNLTATETPNPTTETIFPTSLPTLVFLPPPAFCNNVYLSEIMVNPVSGENEWIEIYNNNDFVVLLNNWFIDDLENQGSTPKQFSLEVPATTYRVFDLTSAIFNNSGDTVRLLDSDKNEKDSFEYSFSTQGKTWGRKDFNDNDFCLQEKSKGLKNDNCIESSPAFLYTPAPTFASVLTETSTPPSSFTKTPKKNILKTKVTKINTASTMEEAEGEVLAVYDFQKQTDYKNLIKFFSFNSLAYSLLTIFSLSFKIKFRL